MSKTSLQMGKSPFPNSLRDQLTGEKDSRSKLINSRLIFQWRRMIINYCSKWYYWSSRMVLHIVFRMAILQQTWKIWHWMNTIRCLWKDQELITLARKNNQESDWAMSWSRWNLQRRYSDSRSEDLENRMHEIFILQKIKAKEISERDKMMSLYSHLADGTAKLSERDYEFRAPQSGNNL